MIGVNIGIPVPREPFSFGGLYGTKSKFGDFDITLHVDIINEDAFKIYKNKGFKIINESPTQYEMKLSIKKERSLISQIYSYHL